MSSYDKTQIIETVQVVLLTAIAAAFILVGGWMIGSASAHSNRVEHERQFECIDRGGEMRYVSDHGLVCTDD